MRPVTPFMAIRRVRVGLGIAVACSSGGTSRCSRTFRAGDGLSRREGFQKRCGGKFHTRRANKSASECAFQAMLSTSVGQAATRGESIMAAVRLQDVAAAAGVSQATASRVLNGSSRIPGEGVADRVRAAAADLGYVANAQA